MRMVKTARTPTLEIAYHESGPPDGVPVILLHGWPSDPHDWDGVAPLLFTKRYDDTNLNVGFGLDVLINTAGARAEYGARIGGTDYSLGLIHATAASHTGRMGVRDIPSLPAGDYTIQARFRQDAAGAIGGNSADAYSFWAEEVVS